MLATVGGTEITRRDLADELSNGGGGTDAALDRLVDRVILSRIATDRRLDRSPEYLAAVRRARQSILASLLIQELATDVADPTDAEAAAFVAAHPWMFAQRQQLRVDQLSAPLRSGDRELLAGVTSIEEAARRLAAGGRAVARGAVVIDSGTLPRADAVRLMQAGDDAPVVLSTDVDTRVAVVRARATAPIEGVRALALARSVIRRQSLNAALARIEGQTRRSMTIRYQAGLGPAR